jgi:T-complex protein 1 subunit gamma
MLKMLLDPMGGIVLTNDGHAILREIEVAHPAAKSMIELSRTQDEEVGDGTTTVIILGTTSAQSLRSIVLTFCSWRNSGSSPSTA